MIKIQEINELVPAKLLAQLTPGKMGPVVSNIAHAARNHWLGLVAKDSSHMRFDYISGIQEVEMEDATTAAITLVGDVAHILENGEQHRDMREFLLGPDVPVVPVGERGKHESSKGGFYRAIPFRHTTPGTQSNPRGPTIGQEMGSAYSRHPAVRSSRELGEEVYKHAKKLQGHRTAPKKGTTKKGGRLQAGLAPKLRKHHKTDIYAGMIKSRKKYEIATQTTYHTFRTISTDVSIGWYRTISGRHFIQQVEQFIAQIAPKAIEAMMEGR